VCRYYTLTLTKTKTISSSSLTILTTTSYQIYIYYLTYYSSLLLYIYQLTIKIHHYLRYISYIHNYYLLTYTENRTHLSIHLFHPTIVWIHISLLSYSIYYTLPLLLYHYYFIITTSSLLLHHYYFIITTLSLLLYHIVNIPYVYVHTYIHTYNHTYNHTQSYIQSLVLITTHIFI
jgi:hypothetical protein